MAPGRVQGQIDANEQRKFLDYVSVYSEMAVRLEVQAALWEFAPNSDVDPRKKQH